MVGKQEIGRIDVVPPHEHIPPDEAAVCRLAQIAYRANRLPEPQWHIWSEQEIDDYTVAWGVPRTVAEICLNFQQLEAAACRHVGMGNLGELAARIEDYGQDREALGIMGVE